MFIKSCLDLKCIGGVLSAGDSQYCTDTCKNISRFLVCPIVSDSLPKVHKGLTNIQAQWLLERNQSHIHDFGRDRFAIWHGQRLDEYSRNAGMSGYQANDNRAQGIESARLARQVTVGDPISFELNLEWSVDWRLVLLQAISDCILSMASIYNRKCDECHNDFVHVPFTQRIE